MYKKKLNYEFTLFAQRDFNDQLHKFEHLNLLCKYQKRLSVTHSFKLWKSRYKFKILDLYELLRYSDADYLKHEFNNNSKTLQLDLLCIMQSCIGSLTFATLLKNVCSIMNLQAIRVELVVSNFTFFYYISRRRFCLLTTNNQV